MVASSVSQLALQVAKHTEQEQRAEAKRDTLGNWWAVNGTNVFIAAFTALLVFVAWKQWSLYEDQVILMEKSLAITRDAADAAKEAANAAKAALNLDIAARRRQSIFAIANKFEDAAHRWTGYNFFSGSENAFDHNNDINILSPYIHYLETYHQKEYEKVREAWRRFHGGNASNPVTHVGTYSAHPEWTKDYWINQLFEIADKLREA